MDRSTLVALALIMAAVDVAGAQIIQPAGRDRPAAWTSLSIGWFQHGSLRDPDSEATWDFGSAPQWRATLEFPVGTVSGATYGIAASTSRVPLVYRGSVGAGSCVSCDADANVSQFMGTFRMGGGVGFHQVIDVGLGATLFSNFRTTDGARLGDGRAKTDLGFVFGYGFGFGLSPRTQAHIVQDFGLVIHKRQPGQPNNTALQQVTRFGVRVGLGDRR